MKKAEETEEESVISERDRDWYLLKPCQILPLTKLQWVVLLNLLNRYKLLF
jgi:hypothetical protein